MNPTAILMNKSMSVGEALLKQRQIKVKTFFTSYNSAVFSLLFDFKLNRAKLNSEEKTIPSIDNYRKMLAFIGMRIFFLPHNMDTVFH